MNHIDRFVRSGSAVVLFLLLVGFSHLFADDPPGNISMGSVQETLPSGTQIMFSNEGSSIGQEKYDKEDDDWGSYTMFWRAPKNHDIVYIGFKVGQPHILIVLLDDGRVYELTFDDSGSRTGSVVLTQLSDPSVSQQFKQLMGDALYLAGSDYVYVSRDTGATWQIDTAGLNTSFGAFFSMCLDTAQNPYLAYSNGLWTQDRDSSVWKKVSGFPPPVAIGVFADRQNRLFASSYNVLYMSTDNGVTWTLDTAGMGGQSIYHFGDDAYGNVYAASQQKIWRSDGGTGPWTRIDQSITSQSYEQNPFTYIINTINGDTLLIVSTAYGIYSSKDFGASWKQADKSPSGVIYGYAKTATGRVVESTDLGIFYKNRGDTAWTKTLPPSGSESALPVYQDKAGNLYTLLYIYNPSTFTDINTNWKSTDGGATWFPDTLGLSALGSTGQVVYGVDETGTQHMIMDNAPGVPYLKTPVSGWMLDSSISTGPNEIPILFGSDNNSNNSVFITMINYLNGQGYLWKRPTQGGPWSIDTTGLNGLEVYAVTGDKNGNPIVGTLGNGLYIRNGTVWSHIPSPTDRGTNEGSSTFAASIDSSGALIASFADFGLTTTWHGVYYTTDLGASWHYIGLDSTGIRGLVSYGDTTYAVTYTEGTYILTKNGVVSSVKNESLPAVYRLLQNYPNPFNPSTTIRYQLPATSHVRIGVFNMLGQEVARLVDREEQEGAHAVQFEAAGLPSGAYFYRLEATSGNSPSRLTTSVKKMLLIK